MLEVLKEKIPSMVKDGYLVSGMVIIVPRELKAMLTELLQEINSDYSDFQNIR